MPLNLKQSGDGEWVPFIKYNAKAGRWYIRQDGVDGDIEVLNPVLAFDFANIKTGWLFYSEGFGPEKVWDPSPTIEAAKPAGPKAFKRGFEVVVHGTAQSIGLREFSSTAGSMIAPVLQMYDEYERGAAANPGKVPVFACTGVKPITGKHGTNYSPLFKLQSWVERSRLPFDGDAKPPSTNGRPQQPGTGRPQPGAVWSVNFAIEEAAKHGVGVDAIRAAIKAAGGTGWVPARDTPTVQRMIRDADEMAQGEQQFPDEEPLPAPPPGRDDSEIPFAWLVPFLLPFLGVVV